MDLEQAIEHALNGDAMLFVGAGFSRGARNIDGSPLKLARQFADFLCTEVGSPGGTLLEDVADEFIEKFGVERLIQILQREFAVSEVGEHHLAMAKIPWRRIYTTNYDNVLEMSYTRTSQRLMPVTIGDRIKAVPKTGSLCVHLNGYIDRLNRETLGTEFKLTDTSYVSAPLPESPWLMQFREDFKLVRAVFFVGYSLADLDIKRVLYKSDDIKEKTFFVLSGRKDSQSSRRAAQYGTVLPLDTAQFAAKLAKCAESYVKPKPTKAIGHSIVSFKAPSEIPAFSDELVFNMLLYGNIRSDILWSSIHNGPRYFLERPMLSDLMNHIKIPGSVTYLHSEFGNGKTLFAEGVKCRALEAGYEVYSLSSRSEELSRELDGVLSSSSKALLVIEDYPAWLDVLGQIGLNGNDEVRLLLTARSSSHDVVIDRANTALMRNRVLEVGIDRLSLDDLSWIAALFDEYGLWGDRAAWRSDRKLSYLQTTCGAQFHSILLQLLASPQMVSRLSRIVEDISRESGYHEVLLTILILAVLQYSTDIDTLVDICGQRVLEPSFPRNPAIRQLVDVQRGKVSLRSSVTANFILQRVTRADSIVDALTHIARVSDRLRSSRQYFSLLVLITKFSTLQIILPEQRRGTAVLEYYERIKNLEFCARSPQFWLQYAIASMITEEFERTDRYFKTAYSFARNRENYDTFMIDNHHARFLLTRAIRSVDSEKCMEIFRETKSVLLEQMGKERRYYPYRVAAHYKEFYDTFASGLSGNDRREIAKAAKMILERIERLPDERRSNMYVDKCAMAMRHILDQVEQRVEA